MSCLTSDRIKESVESFQVDHNKRYAALFSHRGIENLRQAAVMIPLLEKVNGWHVLLTHRSEMLVEHRGQVAFPGGASEEDDKDLQDTALREMHEEIGVYPTDVKVFGHLGDMPIVTGYIVRPYVGQIPWPYHLKVANDEVQAAFTVPFNWLIDPDNRSIRYHSFEDREFPVFYFKPYQGHQLWGASAEMMVALLSALGLMD